MLKKNSIYSLVVTAIFFLTSASSSFAEDQNSTTEEVVVSNEATTTQGAETVADEKDKKNEEATEVKVTDVWARASIASSANSAAYFKIHNPTDKEIVIIAANAPEIANNVELHNSFVDEKGVSRMSTIDKVVVPANSDIEFQPAGMHVMLFDLKAPLNAGDKFMLHLIVENGETIKIEGQIRD